MRFVFSLPVWAVLADMIYTFILNVMQSVALGQRKTAPADGLPVSPEIAFNGLQVLANGGMVLVVGFGLLVLLRLNRTVPRGEAVPVGVFSTLGLLAVLAFSLTSVWQWGWALLRLAGGEPAVSAANPRYLAVAACLPFVALLCLWRLAGWYRITKRHAAADRLADIGQDGV
ncbi:hypothetical protein HMPREF9120_02368 [Neisseria sp. oral taxon 020 str. F0370]|uniref:hypothetical protein n=1 Tax=unclassified Neisseria TaxID=2623750 RepID=UPI0002A43CFF|nr:MULTISPECIES: hypothetical protein [unclassified Neisseria]ASP17096.1 hypothetical protein CGZ77_04650 [Neisseria sp. KEM232]EKY04233.1 hypothetical protein HMPREF9120_02368 [Neisseria sp. oral taxon 020 str. F0370]